MGGGSPAGIGLAFEEPRDVSAAIDWVLAQEPVTGKPLTLLASPWVGRRPSAPPPPGWGGLERARYLDVDHGHEEVCRGRRADHDAVAPSDLQRHGGAP